jgi:hypothetical protein
MNTTFRAILGAVALVGGFLALAQATEPASAGQVLLLDNERIVEGIIVREGDRYRIRRELGESWIPANKVIRLCASRDEAFRTLRGRANLQDLDERLRLARWCQLHGLMEQGQAEVHAALQIKPDCNEAKRLLRCFQRDTEPNEHKDTTEVPALPAPTKESVASAPIPNAGLTMEAASRFATRVQPVLMNCCASCHTVDRGGSFRMMNTYGDNALNQRGTQLNLTATMAQLNRANVTASPLLMKAVSIHGDQTQPPLKGRQTPAYRTLEEWAYMAAACMPETPLASAAPVRPTDSVFSAQGKSEGTRESKVTEEWASEARPAPSKPLVPVTEPAEKVPAEAKPTESRDVPRSVSTTPPPPAPEEPADEFDAIHFNRQAHPERADKPAPATISPLPDVAPRSPSSEKTKGKTSPRPPHVPSPTGNVTAETLRHGPDMR